MKKLVSLLIVASVILSMGIFPTFAEEEKVIFSDSFEDGMSLWTLGNDYAKAGNASIATASSDGKKSIYLKDDSSETTPNVYSPYIPITAGKTYTVSGDFKHDKGANIRIYVRFSDISKKEISSVTGSLSSQGNEWGSASKVFTAPADAVYIRLRIAGVTSSVGNGYVDNVKIVEGGVLGETTQITQTPQVISPAQTSGVVYTESFENGLAGWSASDNSCVISTDKASDGKNSVSITDDSETKGPGITSGFITAVPKMSYTAFVDFLDASGTIKIYIKFYDANKKELLNKSSGSKSGDYTGKVTVDSPENTAYAKIIITGNSKTVGKAYVDNVKLEAKALASQTTETPVSNSVTDGIVKQLAAAKPGDTVIIPDGTYNNVTMNITANGTADNPIVLKAENPGKVLFTGKSSLWISGSHLIVENLLFEKCSDSYIVVFNQDSSYCQLKNCAILNSDPIDENGMVPSGVLQRWVFIRGTYNKVTGCYFRGKSANGVLLEIIRKSANPDYHLVENCYFGDYKDGNANGRETIRIGTSGESLSASYSTIQGCFFEECNGEGETISVKSCNNYIINNTLYNNQGSFVLRHGNGTEVRGNLVIGAPQSSRHNGIRVIGEDHKVYNNYFYNTPFDFPALYASDGNPNPLIHEYLEVNNLDAHNNTFINTDTAIMAGEATPNATNNAQNKIIPPEGKIYNNAIISYKGKNPLITGDVNATGIIFENNYAFGKRINYEGGLPQGINEEAFTYTIKDNFLVPDNPSIGADIEDVKKAPKNPFEIIPNWVKEKYYDTGIIKFNVVENDPFNNPEHKIEDLFANDGSVSVYLNSEKMKFDVPPQLINSRTMVPMRAIFEKFNADVLWDEATASATASTYKTVIKITENSDVAYVNDKEVKLDSPATIVNGRFLVPLRFISESFGASVSWIDATSTVLINYEDRDYVDSITNMHPYIENVLLPSSALQSSDDGSASIKYVFDGNFASKWSVQKDDDGNYGYGIFDFGSVKEFDKLYIAFLSHASRVYSYEFFVSEDGVNYTPAVPKSSTTNFEGRFHIHDLSGKKGRYIKYVGYGNTENGWNNISEFVVTGK